MEEIVNLMNKLTISNKTITVDNLVNKLNSMNIWTDKHKCKDEDKSMTDLCDKFESIDIQEDKIILKHKSGMTIYLNFSQCGIARNKAINSTTPYWTTAF
jgi:hypothetical protein